MTHRAAWGMGAHGGRAPIFPGGRGEGRPGRTGRPALAPVRLGTYTAARPLRYGDAGARRR
ncbi:hypothetical protein B9W68_29480 [Streptomyces sp. CS227]|nr:hypothetical protein B9W68_29480 [Streptomyces sp. CS227]